jgi:hypothetical protein
MVWLGHEGGGFAIGVGHVLDHVLLQHGPVGALHQSGETGTDFILASASHFVVEHFNRNAQAFQHEGHLSTHVLCAVNGRHREIAALNGGTVAAVAAFELGTGVPWGFVLFDFVEAAAWLAAPAHAVKNEEFGFWSEESGVAQTGRLQVGFSALGDGARVAVVRLAVGGLDHVASQDQCRLFEEGIDVGRVRVRDQLHVGGFNAFPASDRRAIESVARNELVFVEVRHRHRGVVLFAAGIGETEINKLDVVVFHQLHHVCDGLGHQ